MTIEKAIVALRCLCILAEEQEAKEAIRMAIKALKQPEIIRCKDCKYCVDYGMGGYYCESEDIVPVGNYVEPDGFCNFAGRRK